jgi:hypothetical protein
MMLRIITEPVTRQPAVLNLFLEDIDAGIFLMASFPAYTFVQLVWVNTAHV